MDVVYTYMKAVACNIGEKNSPKTRIENIKVWAFGWSLLRDEEVRCLPHHSFDWWLRCMRLRSVLHPCSRVTIHGCVYVFEHRRAHFARVDLLINSFFFGRREYLAHDHILRLIWVTMPKHWRNTLWKAVVCRLEWRFRKKVRQFWSEYILSFCRIRGDEYAEAGLIWESNVPLKATETVSQVFFQFLLDSEIVSAYDIARGGSIWAVTTAVDWTQFLSIRPTPMRFRSEKNDAYSCPGSQQELRCIPSMILSRLLYNQILIVEK